MMKHQKKAHADEVRHHKERARAGQWRKGDSYVIFKLFKFYVILLF